MLGDPKKLYKFLSENAPSIVDVKESEFSEFAKNKQNMEELYDSITSDDSPIKDIIDLGKDDFLNAFGDFGTATSGGSKSNNGVTGEKVTGEIKFNKPTSKSPFSPENLGLKTPEVKSSKPTSKSPFSPENLGLKTPEVKSAQQDTKILKKDKTNYDGRPLTNEAKSAESVFKIDESKYKSKQPYLSESGEYKDFVNKSKKELEERYHRLNYLLDQIPESNKTDREPLERQLDNIVDYMGNKDNPDRYGVIKGHESIKDKMAQGNDAPSSYESVRNDLENNISGIKSAINSLHPKLNKDIGVTSVNAYDLWEHLTTPKGDGEITVLSPEQNNFIQKVESNPTFIKLRKFKDLLKSQNEEYENGFSLEDKIKNKTEVIQGLIDEKDRAGIDSNQSKAFRSTFLGFPHRLGGIYDYVQNLSVKLTGKMIPDTRDARTIVYNNLVDSGNQKAADEFLLDIYKKNKEDLKKFEAENLPPTRLQKGLFEQNAVVDDTNLVVEDNKVIGIRDKDGYIVQNPSEEQLDASRKFESNPANFEVTRTKDLGQKAKSLLTSTQYVITDMAPMIISGVASGGATLPMAAATFGQLYGRHYQDALEKFGDSDKASAYSAFRSAVESWIELGVGKLEQSTAKAIQGRLNNSMDKIAENVAKRNINPNEGFKQYIGEYAKFAKENIKRETSEEILQQFEGDVVNSLTGRDEDVSSWEDYATILAQTPIAVLPVSTFTSLISRNTFQKDIRLAIENPKIFEKSVQNNIENGVITKEQGNDTINFIKGITEKVNEYKELGLTKKQLSKVSDILVDISVENERLRTAKTDAARKSISENLEKLNNDLDKLEYKVKPNEQFKTEPEEVVSITEKDKDTDSGIKEEIVLDKEGDISQSNVPETPVNEGEVDGANDDVNNEIDTQNQSDEQQLKDVNQVAPTDVQQPEEEPNLEDTSVPEESFTESKYLNEIYSSLKQKHGNKKASNLYDASIRLVDPNKNNIVEIRENGVVVKEGGKYILKPFGNTDANYKQWTLYKGLDVTDQFVNGEETQPIQTQEQIETESIQPQEDILPTVQQTETPQNKSVEKVPVKTLKVGDTIEWNGQPMQVSKVNNNGSVDLINPPGTQGINKVSGVEDSDVEYGGKITYSDQKTSDKALPKKDAQAEKQISTEETPKTEQDEISESNESTPYFSKQQEKDSDVTDNEPTKEKTNGKVVRFSSSPFLNNLINNAVKSGNRYQVVALRLIKKILPTIRGNKLNLVIHTSNDSMLNAQKNAGAINESKAQKGFYNPNTNEIHINVSNITPDVPVHELLHPIVSAIAVKNKTALVTFVNNIINDPVLGKDIKNFVLKNYGTETPDTIQEEIVVTYLGDRVSKMIAGAGGLDQLKNPILKRIVNFFKDLFRDLGINVPTSKLLGAINSRVGVEPLAKALAEALGEGRLIFTDKKSKQKGRQSNQSKLSKDGKTSDKDFTEKEINKGKNSPTEETSKVKQGEIREQNKSLPYFSKSQEKRQLSEDEKSELVHKHIDDHFNKIYDNLKSSNKLSSQTPTKEESEKWADSVEKSFNRMYPDYELSKDHKYHIYALAKQITGYDKVLANKSGFTSTFTKESTGNEKIFGNVNHKKLKELNDLYRLNLKNREPETWDDHREESLMALEKSGLLNERHAVTRGIEIAEFGKRAKASIDDVVLLHAYSLKLENDIKELKTNKPSESSTATEKQVYYDHLAKLKEDLNYITQGMLVLSSNYGLGLGYLSRTHGYEILDTKEDIMDAVEAKLDGIQLSAKERKELEEMAAKTADIERKLLDSITQAKTKDEQIADLKAINEKLKKAAESVKSGKVSIGKKLNTKEEIKDYAKNMARSGILFSKSGEESEGAKKPTDEEKIKARNIFIRSLFKQAISDQNTKSDDINSVVDYINKQISEINEENKKDGITTKIRDTSVSELSLLLTTVNKKSIDDAQKALQKKSNEVRKIAKSARLLHDRLSSISNKLRKSSKADSSIEVSQIENRIIAMIDSIISSLKDISTNREHPTELDIFKTREKAKEKAGKVLNKLSSISADEKSKILKDIEEIVGENALNRITELYRAQELSNMLRTVKDPDERRRLMDEVAAILDKEINNIVSTDNYYNFLIREIQAADGDLNKMPELGNINRELEEEDKKSDESLSQLVQKAKLKALNNQQRKIINQAKSIHAHKTKLQSMNPVKRTASKLGSIVDDFLFSMFRSLTATGDISSLGTTSAIINGEMLTRNFGDSKIFPDEVLYPGITDRTSGIGLLGKTNKEAWKAFKHGLKNDESYALAFWTAMMEDGMGELFKSEYGLKLDHPFDMKDYKDFFDSNIVAEMGQFLGKAGANFIQASESHMVTYNNMMKYYSFLRAYNAIKDNATKEELENIAELVNLSAGTTNKLNNPGWAGAVMSRIFFAFRYYVSRFLYTFELMKSVGDLANKDLYKNGTFANQRGKMLARQLVGIAAINTVLYAALLALSAVSGGEVDFDKDPWSRNFGKLRYKDTYYDLTFFMWAVRSMLGVLAHAKFYTDIMRGNEPSFGTKRAVDVSEGNPADALLTAISGRLNPGLNFAIGSVMNRDFMGRPYSPFPIYPRNQEASPYTNSMIRNFFSNAVPITAGLGMRELSSSYTNPNIIEPKRDNYEKALSVANFLISAAGAPITKMDNTFKDNRVVNFLNEKEFTSQDYKMPQIKESKSDINWLKAGSIKLKGMRLQTKSWLMHQWNDIMKDYLGKEILKKIESGRGGDVTPKWMQDKLDNYADEAAQTLMDALVATYGKNLTKDTISKLIDNMSLKDIDSDDKGDVELGKIQSLMKRNMMASLNKSRAK